jgi:hypothetical protein
MMMTCKLDLIENIQLIWLSRLRMYAFLLSSVWELWLPSQKVATSIKVCVDVPKFQIHKL